MRKKMVNKVALALTAVMSVTAVEGLPGGLKMVNAADSTVNLKKVTGQINRASVHDPSIF